MVVGMKKDEIILWHSAFDYRMLFDDIAGQRHSDQDTIKQKCNKPLFILNAG